MNPPDRLNSRISNLKRIQLKLSASNYADSLYDIFFKQASAVTSGKKLTALDKLYSMLERDYQRRGLVGRGYHCLEHSMETALLTLIAQFSPVISRNSDRLEMAVSALLHDYDPFRVSGTPKVEHTVKLVKLDSFLAHLFDEMELDASKIALLIERTDYPMNADQEQAWKERVSTQLSGPEAAAHYIKKGEMLAHLDKSATYVCLVPQNAIKRVEELADELGRPREALLIQTYDFLQEHRVAEIGAILPEPYRSRWELVEQYFLIVSGVTGPAITR